MESESLWNVLPTELSWKIIDYLDFSDRLELRRVCQAARQLVDEAKFLQNVKFVVHAGNLGSILTYATTSAPPERFVFTNVRLLHDLVNSAELESLMRNIGHEIKQLEIDACVLQSAGDYIANVEVLSVLASVRRSGPPQYLHIGELQHLRRLTLLTMPNDTTSLLRQVIESKSITMLESVTVVVSDEFEYQVAELLEKYSGTLRKLQLRFRSCLRQAELFLKSFQQLTKVESLTFESRYLFAVEMLLNALPEGVPLEQLAISYSHNVDDGNLMDDIFERWGPQLTRLTNHGLRMSLQRYDLSAAGNAFPKLIELNIYQFVRLNRGSYLLDPNYTLAPNNRMKMLSVDVRNLSEANIIRLADLFPNLHTFHINGYGNSLTDFALAGICERLSKLERLRVSVSIDGPTNEGLISLSRLVRLVHLELNMGNCVNERTLSEVLRMPNLRILSLDMSNALPARAYTALAQNIPSLESLQIFGPGIDETTVASIIEGFKRLRTLNIARCKLSEFAWQEILKYLAKQPHNLRFFHVGTRSPVPVELRGKTFFSKR